jgi:glycosyltransferase involved in cell wall biosynthesis
MGPRNQAAFASLLTSGQLRRIVTISAALRDEFLRRHGELSPLLAVAHDGADAAPAMDRTPAVRPNPGRLQVGYAGHLYDGKGIELIAELVRRCPWADFLIVGGAPDIVERWRGRLAGHANVRFCGQVPHAEVPDYLAGCQVVLAPYAKRVLISDGRTDVSRWMSPLKIFEYMALGKAILCSDLPVLREILEDGHTALLCPPEEPEYWASALQRLAGNPALICSLAAAALATFESRHTWRKRAGAILTDVIS